MNEKYINNLINLIESDNIFAWFCKNNSYNVLKNLITKIYRFNYNPSIIISKQGGFYELPTKELCHVLNTLFSNYRLIEVGAGRGLLSYVLKNNYPEWKIICTDKIENTHTIAVPFKEIAGKFAPFDNTVIVISWLHAKYEEEFIDMIKDTMPKYIVVIGETGDDPIYGSCQTANFSSKLAILGYIFKQLLPIKQICCSNKDEEETLSCTEIYSMEKLDIDIEKKYLGNRRILTLEMIYKDINLAMKQYKN